MQVPKLGTGKSHRRFGEATGSRTAWAGWATTDGAARLRLLRFNRPPARFAPLRSARGWRPESDAESKSPMHDDSIQPCRFGVASDFFSTGLTRPTATLAHASATRLSSPEQVEILPKTSLAGLNTGTGEEGVRDMSKGDNCIQAPSLRERVRRASRLHPLRDITATSGEGG